MKVEMGGVRVVWIRESVLRWACGARRICRVREMGLDDESWKDGYHVIDAPLPESGVFNKFQWRR